MTSIRLIQPPLDAPHSGLDLKRVRLRVAVGHRCPVYCCAQDEHSERPVFLALTKNFGEKEVKKWRCPFLQMKLTTWCTDTLRNQVRIRFGVIRARVCCIAERIRIILIFLGFE